MSRVNSHPIAAAIRLVTVCGLLTASLSCGKGRDGEVTWDSLDIELPTAGLVAEGVSVSGRVLLVGGNSSSVGKVIDVGGNPFCSQHGDLINPTWKVDEDGGFADVVVRVHGSGRASNIDSQPVLVDQRRCEYLPTVVAIQAGQSIVVRNSDLTFHNVRLAFHQAGTLDKGSNLENMGQAGNGEEWVRELRSPGIYRLECDIHRWMKAWIVVHEGVHVAVSRQGGSYAVERALPDGEYVVSAWHPRFSKALTRTVQVVNGSATADFTFDFTQSFDAKLALDS